jgi:hypothetical protein
MLSARLHELQIDSNEGEGGAQAVTPEDSDIVAMQAELATVAKDYESLGERFKRVNIVND